jgi:hypothetical protein
MSATKNTLTPQQQNAALRAQFIANSFYIRKTLPTVVIVPGTYQYSIPLNNQGALVGIDIEVTVKTTQGASAGVPNAGCPYTFLSNINFVDQSNIVRHNLSGQGLFDYLNFKASASTGVAWAAATGLASGGGSYPVVADPVVPASVTGGATGTYTFFMHLPIAKSRYNTTGMVLLQTGNNNQPAVLNLSFSQQIAGQGNSPISTAFVYAAGGSIIVHQNYYQPQAGAVAPPIDTNVQWALTETAGDSTNLVVGQTKNILFQTQFNTSAVAIRYYNGSTFNGITDVTSIQQWSLGGSLLIDDDTPLMRYRRYRVQRGYDNAPGLFWFDYSNNPLLSAEVGIYQANFVPATVNAGAYVTQLYDWLKLPQDLQTIPGANQIG